MKWSKQTAMVLNVLDQNRWMYGYEIINGTGLASGTLYPILRRLTDRHLVTRKQERANPRVEGRPLRVYYRITNQGREQAAIWRQR